MRKADTQIKKCKNNIDCIVATESKKIYNHVKSFNGEVLITSDKHISGTDRCNEALGLLNKSYDLVINVQGDEPIINPELIDELINSFCLKSDQILTPVKKTNDLKEINDQNVVKVDFDSEMNAEKFYRKNKTSEGFRHKHIGVYVFTPKTQGKAPKPVSGGCREFHFRHKRLHRFSVFRYLSGKII